MKDDTLKELDPSVPLVLIHATHAGFEVPAFNFVGGAAWRTLKDLLVLESFSSMCHIVSTVLVTRGNR